MKPDWHNSRSRVGAKTIGVLLVALAIWAIVRWGYGEARYPGFMSPGAEECRARYRLAHTAADSARVDIEIPATGGQKGWTAQRCGLIRERGVLR